VGKRNNETVYVSIMLSQHEKDILDAAVAAATPPDEQPNRNKFIRGWIATLWKAPAA